MHPALLAAGLTELAPFCTISATILVKEIEMRHDAKDMSREQRLSSEERKAALLKLRGYFAKVDAQRKPVSKAEEEEIITEALRSTRPNYRPIH